MIKNKYKTIYVVVIKSYLKVIYFWRSRTSRGRKLWTQEWLLVKILILKIPIVIVTLLFTNSKKLKKTIPVLRMIGKPSCNLNAKLSRIHAKLLDIYMQKGDVSHISVSFFVINHDMLIAEFVCLVSKIRCKMFCFYQNRKPKLNPY